MYSAYKLTNLNRTTNTVQKQKILQSSKNRKSYDLIKCKSTKSSTKQWK